MSEKPQLTRQEKARRIAYRKRRKIIFPAARITALLTVAASLIFLVVVLALGILPLKYILLLMFVLGAIDRIVYFLGFSRKVNNKNKVIQTVISLMLSIGMIIGSIKIPAYRSKIERMFNQIPLEKEVVYNVYVLRDSTVTDLKGLEQSTLGFQSNMEDEEVEYIFDSLSQGMSVKQVATRDCHSVIDAVNKLYNGVVDAVVLNATSVSILNNFDDYKDFATRAKSIYQCTRNVRLPSEVDKVKSITTTPFVVGIVGNDEWFLDDLTKTDEFRSDVNMIVTVNPNTAQVLLVSVPRDSYVAVNGEDTRMDKLTHATFFTGIPGWIKTLENLLGFDMNYFVKVNFSSVVKIIDAIGGLDIDNPYEFSTGAVAWYDEENEEERSRLTTFPEGQIHLTGAEALGYVRERKSLPDGDLGRNLHQTIVIKALVKKAASPEVIMNFEKLLNALSNTFLTNMETKQIIELGRFQLDKSPNWEIMTVSIKGESDFAYSMEVGEELSMLILDQESVNKATYYIKAMLNGERISIGN